MAARWVPAVRWLAVGLVLGYAALSLFVGRSLAALGSWTFVDSLTHEGFWPGDPYRFVGTHLAQAPIALALDAGVTDVGVLRWAHGFGYLLIPAVMWAAALILVRRSAIFEFVLLGYCVTALTCDYIAVADVNLLFASSALLFAIIVRYFTEGGRGLPWLAFVVSWVAAFTHGFALLLAPMLVITIVLLRARTSQTERARLPWLLTMAVLGIGTVVSAISILKPFSPLNVQSASDPVAPLQNPQLLFLVLWLALLPLAVVPRARPVRRAAMVLLVCALVLFAVDERLWPTPLERHATRGASAVLLLVILMAGLLVVLRGMRAGGALRMRPAMIVLPVALTAALLVPLVVQAFAFSTYLSQFQAAITGRDGRIAYVDFLDEVPDAANFEWPYSLPTMSVVLGIGRQHAIVESPADNPYISAFDINRPPDFGGRFTGSVVGG